MAEDLLSDELAEAERWFDAVLQLASLLLARDGQPYEQPADPGWQDPDNKAWTDEARQLVHYALEGGLDWDYLEVRLRELGPYVSPSALCSCCGERLTAEEAAFLDREQPGDSDRLCDACADPLGHREAP